MAAACYDMVPLIVIAAFAENPDRDRTGAAVGMVGGATADVCVGMLKR